MIEFRNLTTQSTFVEGGGAEDPSMPPFCPPPEWGP